MIIRWVSEDGKRKWIYPVKKDIYNNGKIIKQIGRKLKVIGITKVNIPSPLHPITPYNIILLQDEYGNRLPKKTMKDYNIGDQYNLDPAKTEGAVVVTKIKYDLGEYLKESLRLLNEYEVGKADKIVIKPSIIEPAYEYQSVVTSSKVIDVLISLLKEKGVEDIIVAEQAMLGNDVMVAAKKSGILGICKNHDVPFVDLSKSEFVEKNSDGVVFRIAKEILERKMISVPVMKTHSQLSVAGAMENMIRVVDKKTQLKMFEDDIEKSLPKLVKILPQFLTIGEATIGLQGEGPTLLGEPSFLNMFFVSKDPVALDSVFISMGMLRIPSYLKEAEELGIGNNDINSIELIGTELDAIKFRMKGAENGSTAHPHINLIDGKANPYIFNTALKMSAKLFGLVGHDLYLAIGKHISEDMLKGKNRVVAYGNNAIQSMKKLGLEPIAEIQEEIDDVEKVVLLKSILENPDKKGISLGDKVKSKIAKFGLKVKKGMKK